jgi:hypothetical protein
MHTIKLLVKIAAQAAQYTFLKLKLKVKRFQINNVQKQLNKLTNK